VKSQQIYTLIKPFIKAGTIVSRSLADIENSIDDFITIEGDSKIIACCGVREYKNYCEIYCLAVNEKYQGQGISVKILQKVENTINKKIIALSKYQGDWFLNNGFVEGEEQELPNTIVYNTKRKPSIFIKNI